MTEQRCPPTVTNVLAARGRIAEHIVPIQVRRSRWLSELTGRDIWLVLECLQRTGSFKFRGALNRLLLHADHSSEPLMTVSSGNHAIGMTIAGQIAGVRTKVVVAKSVSRAKLRLLESIGANVVLKGENFDEAEQWLYSRAEADGIEIVSSFDAHVIAGHATLAWDVLCKQPDLSALLVPVASGGLLAGCSLVAKTCIPSLSVIGVQTANAPAMKSSLEAGRLVSIDEQPTIADGLAGNVLGSRLPFEMIRDHVRAIYAVGEDSLLQAIRQMHERERLVVEPAGAATVAALLEGQIPPGEGPIAVVLSGSNIHQDLLMRALTCDG